MLAPRVRRHLVLMTRRWLRAYFMYDRRRLGLLSRVAYRLTPQPEQACEFFGKLLGWTYVWMTSMGHTVTNR